MLNELRGADTWRLLPKPAESINSGSKIVPWRLSLQCMCSVTKTPAYPSLSTEFSAFEKCGLGRLQVEDFSCIKGSLFFTLFEEQSWSSTHANCDVFLLASAACFVRSVWSDDGGGFLFKIYFIYKPFSGLHRPVVAIHGRGEGRLEDVVYRGQHPSTRSWFTNRTEGMTGKFEENCVRTFIWDIYMKCTVNQYNNNYNAQEPI